MSKASERRISRAMSPWPSGRPRAIPAPRSPASPPATGDLMVVGRKHGPHAHRGSVSRYCRSHAGCPVVVVPTDQESL
jgi:nucleotide-binding universal stress UspA family protein